MSEGRISEAEVIDRAERIVKARQRVAYAEQMLGVCSEFTAKHWEEVLEDSREFLADLEKEQAS